MEDSLDELDTLCRSAGGDVVGRLVQAPVHIHPGHIFGTGKLHELRDLCRENRAQLVIYDGDLSASQQEKLEEFLDVAVIDRPALILDIFARHARSREAKTQVELAQLEYLLPRLAGHWSHLERQEAAIGTRGPGETQLETDRRLVRRKILDLKKTLRRIDQSRDTQRKRRSKIISFCLVGYTNAGKSSIFNRLTGENAFVADKLFATLDSTTRRVPLEGRGEFLLSDTVGFIKKLPVDLVASFRSTLKEASEADMLIHVADISAPDIETRIATVNLALADIGAADIDRLIVFNKIDLIEGYELRKQMLAKYPGSQFASAVTGEGIDSLRQALADACESMYVELEARLSTDQPERIGLASKLIDVHTSNLENGKLILCGKILKIDALKLEKEGIEINILKHLSPRYQ